MQRIALATLAALALVGPACSEETATPDSGSDAPVAAFVVPGSLDELSGEAFFDHPFPSDMRRDAKGEPVFRGYPNPFRVRLFAEYLSATEGTLHGFSPAAAIYLRFSSALDAASLPPNPGAATTRDATVQLIDVDPASSERGTRRLAIVRSQTTDGVYVPKGTVAVMPMPGAPLRPKTRYAVVVTTGAKSASGAAAQPNADLREVLGLTPETSRTQALRELYGPAIGEVEAAGVARASIAHLTVFTTDDPTAETFALLDHAKTTPAPSGRDLVKKESTVEYDVYEGVYGPSPTYQVGTAPFSKSADGGGLVFEAGHPQQQGSIDLRFALVVPSAATCPEPAGGYPIVLYAHGTGGDYRSFIDDGTARALARQCLASTGIDQVLHGTRPGAPPLDAPDRESKIQLYFFNFENPIAARTNNRQAAVDLVQQARLFTESHLTVPAAVTGGNADVRFDGARVLFFGHSQGGLNGPLFLAGSDLSRGGVLSGAGSVFGIALLEKTMPVNIPAAVRLIARLGGDEGATEFDLLHPIITLAQSLVDVADPIHYGPNIVGRPRSDFAPKSVYQTEGINVDGTGDTYAPPRGIEALATSIGLPRLAPGVSPIPEATWAGLSDVELPEGGLAGNLAGGRATGVLAQFAPPRGRDGHFVVFNVPAARDQAARFCRALADDPVGRVTP